MNILTSGQTYNLREIFTNSKNGKIIIPDLQRDYCWGNTGTLVQDFVENIKKHFAMQNEGLMMGLLYGYYEEARPYLQLCDGQQRLTTLFLLMGLINRKCVENPFQEILISDFELNEDDREPNLLYSIRDSSLYFLSDLVCNFFITKGDERAQDGKLVSEFIQACNWWFLNYENDPTIKNMLDALDTIDRILPTGEEELKRLGEYIETKLQFVFFDMEDRRNGEETFVIINTTGEPLTATENLKPLIVTKNDSFMWEEDSRKWEVIDNWFWRNRDKDYQDTSDVGMKEFLRWVAGVYAVGLEEDSYYKLLTEDEYSFPYSKIGMDNIWGMYETLKYINEETSLIGSCPLLSIPQGGKYDLRDYFIILPTLFYLQKFKGCAGIEAGVGSIYRFFQNLRRYTEITIKNNNIRFALEAVSKLSNPDLCSLLNIKECINSTYILTNEEEIKLKILQSHPEIRNELEIQFEKMASHEVLSGRIYCLINWSGGGDNFNLDDFKGYAKKFSAIFMNQKHNVVSDITALALVTAQLSKSEYPIPVGNNFSLGLSASEWNFLIYGNRDKGGNIEAIGRFLQKIDWVDIKESEVRVINEWISEDANKDHMLYPLVKGYSIPEAEFQRYGTCWGKMFKTYPSGVIRVLCSVKQNYRDFYLLDDVVLPCNDESGQWNKVWSYENYCLVMDHKEYDISIDLLFDNLKDNRWRLRIFERNNNRKRLTNFATIVREFGENEDGRKISEEMPLSQLMEFVKRKKEEIRKLIGYQSL